jgi:hypothetical protein
MEVGEFEYVKPLHLQVNKDSDEDDDLPTYKRKQKSTDPNPLINGIPRAVEPIDQKTAVQQSNDMAKEEVDGKPKGTPNQGHVTEIEIELDDSNTSTQKITVKETTRPIRGRTPKLYGLEEEIAEKYSQGITLKDLAEIYGVSVPCMASTVRRAGVEIRSRGRQKKG